jgi:large subunit ribosomal protein L44
LKPETPTRPGVLHVDALSSVPRALTGLVYTHRSLATARKFAHAFFLGRDVDLRPMLKFEDPKKALSDTVRKFGRERPVSRFVSTRV